MEISTVAGSAKVVGWGGAGLLAVGALSKLGSLLGAIPPDTIPSITIAATGTLGLIWAGFEWFRSKSDKLHVEQENLLRSYLIEANNDVKLSREANRLLEKQHDSERRTWEDERKKLVAEVAELNAQYAGLLERSGEHGHQS